jgi:hypothetical protein
VAFPKYIRNGMLNLSISAPIAILHEPARNPKISELHCATSIQQNISRFKVSYVYSRATPCTGIIDAQELVLRSVYVMM